MNLQRMLKYLNLAFSLGFLWEQFRALKATDPATRTEDYAGVAALVLAQPKAQPALAAMARDEQAATAAGLPGALRLLDALASYRLRIIQTLKATPRSTANTPTV